MLRSACEHVENSEKVLALALHNKKRILGEDQPASTAEEVVVNQQQSVVWWDLMIKKVSDDVQVKCRQILEVYEDNEGDFKKEQNVFCGAEFASQELLEGARSKATKNSEVEPNVWDNFYTKLSDMEAYHNKYDQANH